MNALGDGWPNSGGSPDELTGLPPEWGPIVIPDDPAELAAEAVAVQRELRRRRRRGIPATVPLGTPARYDRTSLRASLLVVVLSILATLAGLIAVTWPRPTHRPAAAQPAGQTASVTTVSGGTLPALDLVGVNGAVVPLRGLLPAVIILTDGCDCGPELAAAVGAAPPGVTVVEVTGGRSVPSPPPGRPPAVTAGVRRLADPVGELRSFLRPSVPAGTHTALLVARSGHVVRVLPTAAQVPDHPADLARLATG